MAKIASVRASAHSCPFEGPIVRMGLGGNTKRDTVLVRIRSEDGVEGIGEAHHGQNPTAMAEIIEKGLGTLIIGEDPFDSEGIWARLSRQQVVTHGLGAGSVIGLSGIDNALWDLKGKLLGQPVYRLLGGTRRRTRAYAGGLSLGFQALDTLEKEVAGLLAEGYTAIKMRVGDTVKKDAERVGHIRKTFGDELDIAVDAATRYTLLDIPEVLKYCEANRVYWLEEPFTPDNIGAYAELRRRTAIPIAAGENHYTRQAFRDLFEARAVSICQADPMKAGGLSELKKIADMAAAWHIHMAPHTSHSVLSAAVNAHLLSVIPNGLIYEADVAKVNPFRTDLATKPFGVVNGHIEPNDAPGLGIELNEQVLKAYPAVPGPCYIPGR
ncbi:MAG: mandelate racemase/muconate lactonizing enzyme family protein [Alphaproteobacteria bacterium]